MNSESQDKIFEKIVTVGSGDKIATILINFSTNLGLNTKFGYKLIKHLERKWKLKLTEFATQNAAKKVKIPVLVVHDTIDGDVHVNCALNIRKNLENGELLITNGFGHTKILRDKIITTKIVNFIKK